MVGSRSSHQNDLRAIAMRRIVSLAIGYGPQLQHSIPRYIHVAYRYLLIYLCM